MIKMRFNLEKPKPLLINNSSIFNKNMNYYICSAGGCGSTLIFNYLKNFGNVFHIHDRYPPDNLTYVGSENTEDQVYDEWFNTTKIPEDKINLYKVIFLYRNPIDVIFSRFIQPHGPNITHLQHIKCINNGLIGLGDIIKSGKDLYGLEEFYDRYVNPKTKRNYKIYCVKYEGFFNNISLFNESLGLPDIKQLYPSRVERPKKIIFAKELLVIYQNLIVKMKKMPFIKIIDISSIIGIKNESDINLELSNVDDDV
jgi:hypothetical protein